MNSCLADLSRLIPPQYQRKGRGRIEKTEIIEMAIRHLKHLQSECLQKDNEYRVGYTDCMKEAAKFLYDSQMQEFCYRLLARLQEHCDEIMKSKLQIGNSFFLYRLFNLFFLYSDDCFRSRGGCHVSDNVSASSGSPHQTFHPVPPLCQLRDILGASDIEHSNDHNDVKDLSFRNHINQLQRNVNASQMDSNANDGHGIASVGNSSNNNNISTNSTTAVSGSVVTSNNPTSSTTPASNLSLVVSGISTAQQPHQAPVITSTAPASLLHHTDSSNHDFDSSREPLIHTDTSNMHSPPPRDALLSSHHLNNAHSHLGHHQDSMVQARLRNYSESSHDIEHNNNYKYKNHIKERFNHELHDEETSSEHGTAPPLLQSENSRAHSEHSKDGTETEITPMIAKKRKLAEACSSHNENAADEADVRVAHSSRTNNVNLMNSVTRDEKPFGPFSDIKTEASAGPLIHNKTHLSAPTSTTAPLPARSFAVPIFALHSQGTYYVPLNVDYNVLIPFLNGVDLLEKNFTSMPVVHPININVNFMPTSSASLLAAAAAAVAAGKQQQQQQQAPTVLNGSVSTAAANAVAAVTKAKFEAITNVTNGW